MIKQTDVSLKDDVDDLKYEIKSDDSDTSSSDDDLDQYFKVFIIKKEVVVCLSVCPLISFLLLDR